MQKYHFYKSGPRKHGASKAQAPQSDGHLKRGAPKAQAANAPAPKAWGTKEYAGLHGVKPVLMSQHQFYCFQDNIAYVTHSLCSLL